ncbi:hypothetical protein [Rheinheimera sp. NSM]|uniref:hypothetical protein n=1 Tax=Rheinheimera sp. NSM TaxID=3457884 RepID=UPI0040353001
MIKRFSAILLLSFCFSAPADELKFAIDYSEKTFQAYDERVGACRLIQRQHTAPTEAELKRLQSMQYSPYILPYLEERAFNQCVMAEKAQFMEALLMLEQFSKSAKNQKLTDYVNKQKSENFHASSLKVLADYMMLPETTRQTFESVESLQKPFNGILMLETIWPQYSGN